MPGEVLTATFRSGVPRHFNTLREVAGALSFSEETVYSDQIVIVDGIGITHFIPRRPAAEKAAPAKKQKRKSR